MSIKLEKRTPPPVPQPPPTYSLTGLSKDEVKVTLAALQSYKPNVNNLAGMADRIDRIIRVIKAGISDEVPYLNG